MNRLCEANKKIRGIQTEFGPPCLIRQCALLRQYIGAAIILVVLVFLVILAFWSFLLYGYSSIPVVLAFWSFHLSPVVAVTDNNLNFKRGKEPYDSPHLADC
jgi:hypothetical protein